MISKELMSIVLNVNIRYMSDRYDNNLVPYETDKWNTINIYELTHKCKEWALSKGHTFNVQMSPDITLVYIGSIGKDIEAPTEPEATFLACEWILKETI